MIGRRRLLQIAAGAALAPGAALAGEVWAGRALGADLSVRLRGPGARAALAGVPAVLERVEAAFSLFRPDSELSRLNAAGGLAAPSAAMAALLDLSDALHRLTGGLFDPTVQPLWQALATGGDVAAARARVGWGQVQRQGRAVRLGPGQALTFNGLAQGFAADAVRAHLAAAGFGQALVDMGEVTALGGPWRLGIADGAEGVLATRALVGRAMATSSAEATRVGGVSHILHPLGGAPVWATVSVEADSAALADGLSTALILCPRDGIARLVRLWPEARLRVVLVDRRGDLVVVEGVA